MIPFFFLSTHCMLQPILSKVVQLTAERGKKFSSLFFPASQMEKQFITLSDSLSKTDMIKNNIK